MTDCLREYLALTACCAYALRGIYASGCCNHGRKTRGLDSYPLMGGQNLVDFLTRPLRKRDTNSSDLHGQFSDCGRRGIRQITPLCQSYCHSSQSRIPCRTAPEDAAADNNESNSFLASAETFLLTTPLLWLCVLRGNETLPL